MEPSARELRAAKRTAKREGKRQAAGPAVFSGTGSDEPEVVQSSRERRAVLRAAKRESEQQAAGPVVPSSGTGSDGREVVETSGATVARPDPALTAIEGGRRALGQDHVKTRLVARRLQSAAREARGIALDDMKLIGGGQPNYYTISHDYKPPIVGAGQTSEQWNESREFACLY